MRGVGETSCDPTGRAMAVRWRRQRKAIDPPDVLEERGQSTVF